MTKLHTRVGLVFVPISIPLLLCLYLLALPFLRHSTSNNRVILKTVLWIIQGHSRWIPFESLGYTVSYSQFIVKYMVVVCCYIWYGQDVLVVPCVSRQCAKQHTWFLSLQRPKQQVSPTLFTNPPSAGQSPPAIPSNCSYNVPVRPIPALCQLLIADENKISPRTPSPTSSSYTADPYCRRDGRLSAATRCKCEWITRPASQAVLRRWLRRR